MKCLFYYIWIYIWTLVFLIQSVMADWKTGVCKKQNKRQAFAVVCYNILINSNELIQINMLLDIHLDYAVTKITIWSLIVNSFFFLSFVIFILHYNCPLLYCFCSQQNTFYDLSRLLLGYLCELTSFLCDSCCYIGVHQWR